MNASDIRAEAEKRLAEIATQRAALDVEEAQLRAMLGAPAAVPTYIPTVLPCPLPHAPPYAPYDPPTVPWTLEVGPYRPTTTSDKIRISYGDPSLVGSGITICGGRTADNGVGAVIDAQHGQRIDGTQYYAGGSALQ